MNQVNGRYPGISPTSTVRHGGCADCGMKEQTVLESTLCRDEKWRPVSLALCTACRQAREKGTS